jgi:hypothetical protein
MLIFLMILHLWAGTFGNISILPIMRLLIEANTFVKIMGAIAEGE